MSKNRFSNVIAAIGDSLTWMGEGYKLNRQNWVSVLEYSLAGFGTSAVVSVSGSTVTVMPGTGVWFQPGTSFVLRPAGISVRNNRGARSAINGPQYTVTALSGDTITVAGALPSRIPAGAQVLGTGGGASVVGLNCGHSGDTTPQMLARVGQMFALGTPALALILGGTNDLNAQGSSTIQNGSATTTSLPVAHASVVASTGMCAGLAWAGSYVTVNGVSGNLVKSVAAGSGSNPDIITLATPLASAPASGVTVAVDTTNTLIAIGTQIAAGGVANVLMLGQPGHDWAAGGDFPTPSTNQTTTLACQQAAATALGIPYCSIWAFMAARINAGVDGATSSTYTYMGGAGAQSTNPHPSVYGDQVYAMAVMAGLVQAGLLASLA